MMTARLPEQPISLMSHMPRSSQPRLSIVVAADRPVPALDVMMTTLEHRARHTPVEVILVQPLGERTNELDAAHPLVRRVTAPAGSALGELRANGLRHARGDVVVLV